MRMRLSSSYLYSSASPLSSNFLNRRKDNLQIVFCVNHASVAKLFPLDSFCTTYVWQLALILPEVLKSWIAVSIRPVNHSTKRMKLPVMMTPGRSERCAARIWMKIMKQTPRLPVVTMKGIILCLLAFRSSLKRKERKERSTMASPIPSVIEQLETMQRCPDMLLRLLGWGWSRCSTGIRASSIFVCRPSWLWDSLPLSWLHCSISAHHRKWLRAVSVGWVFEGCKGSRPDQRVSTSTHSPLIQCSLASSNGMLPMYTLQMNSVGLTPQVGKNG